MRSKMNYPSSQKTLRLIAVAVLIIAFFSIRPEQGISASPLPQTYSFSVQQGTPAYLQNFAHIEKGCDWMGIAGQVFDSNGSPISRMVVRVEGFLGSQSLDILGMTSLATAYGPGGFEIELHDEPLNSSGTLSIALFNLEGERVSEYFPFTTYADCSRNLILVNFQQSDSGPVTPTITPQITNINAVGGIVFNGRPAAPHASLITGIDFQFSNPGQSQVVASFSTTTDQFGRYSITNLPSGTYDIAIKGENTLKTLLPATTLQSGENQFPDVTLRSGDANNDNFVSAADFSLLAASFGKCLGDNGYNGTTDFNNDQCVTAVDFSLLSSNYGQQGD